MIYFVQKRLPNSELVLEFSLSSILARNFPLPRSQTWGPLIQPYKTDNSAFIWRKCKRPTIRCVWQSYSFHKLSIFSVPKEYTAVLTVR